MTKETNQRRERDQFIVWEGEVYRIQAPKYGDPNMLHLLVFQFEYGVRIVIHPNDHNPPHFHVYINKEKIASYRIEDGKRLNGKKDRRAKEKEIKKYWKRDRYVLATVWNMGPGRDRREKATLPQKNWTMPEIKDAEARINDLFYPNNEFHSWKHPERRSELDNFQS